MGIRQDLAQEWENMEDWERDLGDYGKRNLIQSYADYIKETGDSISLNEYHLEKTEDGFVFEI